MISSLARERLVDRLWTASVLADLASFWHALCRLNANARPGEWGLEWALELRLGGFPRSAAQAVRAALAPRAGAAPGQTVSAPDPDTVVVSWDPLDRAGIQPAGLGLPLLAAPVFEGLVLELRFTLAEGRAPLDSTNTRGHTLIVLGEMRGGALLARTLWAGRAEASELKRDYTPMPTDWETALLAAFDHFRETRRFDREVLTGVFHFPPAPQTIGPFARWLKVPFGHPRWPGLLVRCAAFTAALIGLLILLHVANAENAHWLRASAIALALVWSAALLTFIKTEAKLILENYAPLREANDAANRRPARYAKLAPEEAAARLDDPQVRKYTTDLIEHGFVYLGDVASIPHARATGTYRIFGAPDGITYSILTINLKYKSEDTKGVIWPALVLFECQTFFSDGGRVDSLNGASFETHAPDPTNLLLGFPSATHPLALFRSHTAAAEEFGRRTFGTPLRHGPFELFIQRQNEISANEYRGYAERPYSWRAHLRWYLQLRSSSGNG